MHGAIWNPCRMLINLLVDNVRIAKHKQIQVVLFWVMYVISNVSLPHTPKQLAHISLIGTIVSRGKMEHGGKLEHRVFMKKC